MNVLVLIPGFGAPHEVEKGVWLRSKIQTLVTQWRQSLHSPHPWRFDMWLFVYDNSIVPNDLAIPIHSDDGPQSIAPSPHLYVKREHGILAQYMIKYCKPDLLRRLGYTHVLATLDDVEFVNINIAQLKQYYDEFKLDIVQPALSKNSRTPHPNMMVASPSSPSSSTTTITSTAQWSGTDASALTPRTVGRVVNGLEWFCYFLDIDRYERWYGMFDMTFPWMWGIDLVVYHHFKMRVAIIDEQQICHYLSDDHSSTTGATTSSRWYQMLDWLQRTQYEHRLPSPTCLVGQTLAELVTSSSRVPTTHPTVGHPHANATCPT